MVARQLRRRGIGDASVLEAMATVPRERFVAPRLARRAYADSALPIGEAQTISQPWVVAAICQSLELRPGADVLEVGTGSGYSTAVLARMGARVLSLERQEGLAEDARRRLAELDLAPGEAEVRVADGSVGAPDRAPFEAIAVHATAPEAPASLLAQLREGGRMVIPLAAGGVDMLTRLRRTADGLDSEALAPCRFVPLVGEEGFESG